MYQTNPQRHLSKFTAAAVQSSPVFLDVDATIDKCITLIQQATSNEAKLVVFPEVFIAGYPYWNWIMTPVQGSKWYERLYLCSVALHDDCITRLRSAVRNAGCYCVKGINERGCNSAGTIYNTLITIDPQGDIVAHHRKFVPTWAEKLTWTGGDGSSLNVIDTALGPLGSLACGENTNPLARFALLQQGELIHTASYIALPVAPADYDMAQAIKLRSCTHSFEGKIFTITACSTISDDMIALLSEDGVNYAPQLKRKSSAWSGVIGPDGLQIGDALIDDEGIVYAEIDLMRCIQPKQMHDILGHYNRADVFELKVNKKAQHLVTVDNETPPHVNLKGLPPLD